MNAFAHLLWAVANSLWQSALIATLAWASLRCIRTSSAALRYAVWSVVLLACAVLPAVNAAEPAPVVLISSQAPVSYKLTDVSLKASPAHAAASKPVHFSVTAAAFRATETKKHPQPQRAAVWTSEAAASAAAWMSARAFVAVWVWIAIASLLFVRLGAGFMKLRRIKRGLVPIDDEEIAATCRVARRPVVVGVSDDVDCPCVIGYGRPVIALPSALVRDLDRTDLQRVLAHELGHIRRWDDWANLVQQLVRSIWFFNPIVHVACRALDVNREIACDDLVAAGHIDRLEYAKCLTEIARRTTFAEHLAPAAGFFPDRRQIVVRIEQLLDRNHHGSARVGVIPAISAAVLLVAVMALAKHQVPAFALGSAQTPVLAVPARPNVAVTAAKTAARTALKAKAVAPATAAKLAPVKAVTASAKAKTLTVTSTVTPAIAQLVAERLAVVITQARVGPPAQPAPAAPAKRTSDDFLDALGAAGYTHLTIDELIAIRNAGVTTRYLRALKEYGVLPMPVSKLIGLANAGVSAEYIAGMRSAGYLNLRAEELISLANAGVSSEFAKAITTSGYPRPSANALVSLANAGVSASYVQNIAKYGYANLSIDSLIALANAGVSSSYVGEMAKQGYNRMSVDTLTALSNAGVSPSYVRSLADVGYSGISTDSLIRMANAGVTAKLIKTLRSHGIGSNGKLSIDELIRLANEGF
jgi:bla regulator protein blaR1